jgi:large subunit ribosomal protein L9
MRLTMSRLEEKDAAAIVGMNVILLEEFEPLGGIGDVVTVRAGFARNYLLPRNKALRASEANRKIFEANRARILAQHASRRAKAQEMARALDRLSLTLIRDAASTGHLFAPVTAGDLCGALLSSGHKIGRSQIMLDRPIRQYGIHDVRILLDPNVSANIEVNVARSEEEAKQQAQGVDVLAMIMDRDAASLREEDAEGEERFESRDAVVAALTAEFATLLDELPGQRLDQFGDLLEQARQVIQEPEAMAGQGLGPLVDLAVGRAAIDRAAVDDLSSDWAQSELLGAADMAKEVGISPATLAIWRREGHVLAFKRDRRNYYYPKRQIHRSAPIAGLAAIAARFGEIEDAWEWLVTPNVHTSGLPPIDRLRLGAREEVERAAEGAFDVA